jgi:hypothetical protein
MSIRAVPAQGSENDLKPPLQKRQDKIKISFLGREMENCFCPAFTGAINLLDFRCLARLVKKEESVCQSMSTAVRIVGEYLNFF